MIREALRQKEGKNVKSVFKNTVINRRGSNSEVSQVESCRIRNRRCRGLCVRSSGPERGRCLDLVDDDKVCLTNLNRQIIATRKTVGKYKVEVMKERMLEINPDVDVRTYQCFFLPENADDFPFEEYDYIVDAVDTVTAKLEIIMRAKEKNVPVISAMGAGNKLDPGRFRIADIYDTSVCPLARVMRRELKKRNVKSLKVVYSDEQPIRPIEDMTVSCRTSCICPPGAAHKCTERRDIPGSTAFVPAVAGLMIAGEIVKDLSK